MSKPKQNKKEKTEGLYQKAISFAVDQLRDGVAQQSIAEDLLENKRLNQASVQIILNKADAVVASQHVRDRASIIAIHVKRYNSEIRSLQGQTFEHYDAFKKRQYRIEALMTMLDVMFAKEKVLQLHTKDTQVRIFNKINAKVQKRDEDETLDLSVLTLEEKIELLSLITKAKRTSSELMSVQLREREAKVEAEEIEYEEVKQTTNVSQIKQINQPIQQELHPIDQLKAKASSSQDIMDKMKMALEKKAVKELKAKGAKINESNLFKTELQ